MQWEYFWSQLIIEKPELAQEDTMRIKMDVSAYKRMMKKAYEAGRQQGVLEVHNQEKNRKGFMDFDPANLSPEEVHEARSAAHAAFPQIFTDPKVDNGPKPRMFTDMVIGEDKKT